LQLLERLFANCALYRHEVIADGRGSLVALEGDRNLPFAIARVYYLYGGAEGAERGFHAHRALQQWAVCVSGACTIVVDDGAQRREVRLDSPDKGLLIGSMLWREMRDFTPGAVLMVLASMPYDEADYIRDYDTFLAEAVRA
jgi:hypothetical protein